MSDESLMERYAAGDASAFEGLFRRYEGRAYAYFVKRTRSRDRALDLYQELFLRIHRMRNAFYGRRPFAPWFFQIAHHLLIDDARRAYRAREVGFERSPSRDPVATDFDDAADREALSSLLDCLSESERELLVAAKLEGVGYAALALRQGRTVGAIKKAISRAMKRIRDRALVEADPGQVGCG